MAGGADGAGIAATGTGCDCAGSEATVDVDLLSAGRGAGSLFGLAGAGACSVCDKGDDKGADGVGDTGLDGAALVAGATVVATTGADAGGVETGRSENRHHTAASTTATAAPIKTSVSGDRLLGACIAGVNFCPVSGTASDIAGTSVIDAIA